MAPLRFLRWVEDRILGGRVTTCTPKRDVQFKRAPGCLWFSWYPFIIVRVMYYFVSADTELSTLAICFLCPQRFPLCVGIFLPSWTGWKRRSLEPRGSTSSHLTLWTWWTSPRPSSSSMTSWRRTGLWLNADAGLFSQLDVEVVDHG